MMVKLLKYHKNSENITYVNAERQILIMRDIESRISNVNLKI
ncbi:MAG: hypothetical protein Nk1A_0060 [Endomicrobiia bacterium]|nr:MAG: hypothetical protein Nk1A_0060 [Endomicrobiia bacterium]